MLLQILLFWGVPKSFYFWTCSSGSMGLLVISNQLLARHGWHPDPFEMEEGYILSWKEKESVMTSIWTKKCLDHKHSAIVSGLIQRITTLSPSPPHQMSRWHMPNSTFIRIRKSTCFQNLFGQLGNLKNPFFKLLLQWSHLTDIRVIGANLGSASALFH